MSNSDINSPDFDALHKINETRIDHAIIDAQDAFWAAMVKAFPEVKTGDFSPGDTMDFDEACKTAARAWLLWNHPKADHGEEA